MSPMPDVLWRALDEAKQLATEDRLAIRRLVREYEALQADNDVLLTVIRGFAPGIRTTDDAVRALHDLKRRLAAVRRPTTTTTEGE